MTRSVVLGVVCVLCLVSVVFAGRLLNPSVDEVDEGTCGACVFVLQLIDINIDENADKLQTLMEGLCLLLDDPEQKTLCQELVAEFGIEVIRDLLQEYNPNEICEAVAVCDKCKLQLLDGNLSKQQVRKIEIKARMIGWAHYFSHLDQSKFTKIGKVQVSEVPSLDVDKDFFSPIHIGVRAADWRGKDCNDLVRSIHPGIPDVGTGLVDNNCNGVTGRDAALGKTYEQLYCETPDAVKSRRSVIMFGDSASAGFHIPPQWVNLQNLTDIIPAALNELDWPQQSWATGYTGPVGNSSIYMEMRARNRCNHRDYQNLSKNGATMKSLVGQVGNIGNTTYPMLAFVSYIGNDVCKKSLDRMTQPEDFRAQLIAGLTSLNQTAVAGSKVVVSGLADGTVLWNTMAKRIHPLGCTYESLYEFLTCTGMNPCNTWLSTDEATRNATTDRAKELSAVAKHVVENNSKQFTNLDCAYVDFPTQEIFDLWEKQGKDPAELIEVIDGFHPSPTAHQVTAFVTWNLLKEYRPDFIGEVNPNNQKIIAQFGDQNGN